MPMQAPEPITRRKLSDEVFDRLHAMIASGEVRPGGMMPSERELMERFGVGRPAIREAMHALSNLGLIAISHGERARVRQLTARAIVQQVDAAAHFMLATQPGSLDHLKEARLFFERGMVREAAVKATDADVGALQGILARQRELLEQQERFQADAFIDADMALHVRLAGITGNPIYEAVSEAMLSWLRQYHTELLIWTGREAVTLAEHEGIVAHVEAHDADAAEAAMVGHLTRSAALYVHHAP